jgi:hypothetical protein
MHAPTCNVWASLASFSPPLLLLLIPLLQGSRMAG